MKYSNAQKEATARYNKKAYDRIDVVVPKGKRQEIKNFATSQGKSLNRFINDAIDYQMYCAVPQTSAPSPAGASPAPEE